MNNLDYMAKEGPISKAAFAAGMLAAVCILWGFSFPVMQIASDRFDQAMMQAHQVEKLPTRTQLTMTATFNGARFAIAAMLYWGLIRWNRPPASKADVRGGVAVGVAYGAGMFLQLLGLRYLLPSVSGFLTSLAVVFAPLAQALVFRRRVGLATWAGVALAVVGILVLSGVTEAAGGDGLTDAPPVRGLGEICTVLASVFFTVQILAVDHWGQSADAPRLTMLMMLICSLVNAAAALVLAPGDVLRAEVGRLLLADAKFLWCMAGLVVFSSVIAFHMMNTYQPWVSAATASVIYCLEPVFSTGWSMLFKTETLATRTVAGGAVILLAVLVATTPLWKRRAGRDQA
jgi:drug/metabolite transporter (DMT)-like permease